MSPVVKAKGVSKEWRALCRQMSPRALVIEDSKMAWGI